MTSALHMAFLLFGRAPDRSLSAACGGKDGGPATRHYFCCIKTSANEQVDYRGENNQTAPPRDVDKNGKMMMVK